MPSLHFSTVYNFQRYRLQTQFSEKVLQAGKRLSLDSGYAEGEEQEELEADEKQVHINLNLYCQQRSSTCRLTGFLWLLNHVIYLKLRKN